MQAVLLTTKFHMPSTPPNLVSRPRLVEQFQVGLHRKLTLISAPAGFGKTTLAASGFVTWKHSVAWLSLDKDDNQVGRFLSYLIGALQGADSMIGNEAARLRQVSQTPPEAILTSLINDLAAADREIALVLDDYHHIRSQTIHEAVAFLLEHAPQTFHLVITTRSDPPLPLVRLRVRGQLIELRAADLSFSEAEAAEFLNDVMNLHLDAESVAVLEERTEGWVAGLQLVALSMLGREDVAAFVEDFSGTNRHILDYLLEEVLARETEEVQTFLLQTSVLTRMTGPLCDTVTHTVGGRNMLEKLERRNLFIVPLDDERHWYRYHHLFADLLQARLQQSDPARARQLLSRAAEWCEHNGQVAEAIDYGLAAEDFERVARLVEKAWGQVANDGEIEVVWSWLNALPEDTIRNSALLSIASCWILWLSGKIDAIEAPLADAERVMHESQMADGNGEDEIFWAGLPAQVAALRAFVTRYRGEYEAAHRLAEQALSLIPDDLPTGANAHLRMLIFLALASVYDGVGDLEKAVQGYMETIRWSRVMANAAGVTGITYRLVGALRMLGRLRAADAACRDALDYIQTQKMVRLPAAGILHVAMSEVLVERNDLAAAEEHLTQGRELGKWSGRLDAARNVAYSLSHLRWARGDETGAIRAVEEAIFALGERPSPLAKAELLALKARILVRQRSPGGAARCIEEALHLADGDQGQTGQMVALAACRVRLAHSNPQDGIAYLTQLLAEAESRSRWGVVLELLILRCLMFAELADTRKALVVLERVLALAEPEGYARVFLNEGEPMQLLIAQWVANAGTGPLRDYALVLLSQFDAERRPADISPNDTLVDPLTPRELEVLHIMALGKTNQEIAQQLVVAPGTVKAHTASIYRKLDVANRTEAVTRARDLNILL